MDNFVTVMSQVVQWQRKIFTQTQERILSVELCKQFVIHLYEGILETSWKIVENEMLCVEWCDLLQTQVLAVLAVMQLTWMKVNGIWKTLFVYYAWNANAFYPTCKTSFSTAPNSFTCFYRNGQEVTYLLSASDAIALRSSWSAYLCLVQVAQWSLQVLSSSSRS
jgi:tRNA threonylcarbamoyladenosine modification (KEOPS) complex  Pcc1 subunit